MASRLWYIVTVLCFFNLNKVTSGLDEESSKLSCVIGAGYSGLGVARYLRDFKQKFKVLEATKYIGGTWRFDPHVGTDEDGLPSFTSQYKNLRTNTPRQTMEFVGFPFPDTTPSYPTGTCFYRYLKLFAKTFDLYKDIQFQSFVTKVKWAGGHWNVTYTKVDTRENDTIQCDFVVVANGHYSKPVLPKFNGIDSFKGKIIHSHDYKDPETFRNRKVLLVGAGPSGLDLATHLVNVTSRLVHSHHLEYTQPNFPKHYIKKPDIKAFTANGVVFEDGTFEEIEDVILCTGFDYDQPFLDESSGITLSGKFLLPLYQHMVNIRYPSMVFLGIPKGVINRVNEAQAEYAAALAAGKFKLPSQEQMLRIWLDHVHGLREKGQKIIDVNVIGNAMDEYFGNLTAEAGVTRAPPVLTEIRDHNAVYRLEDLLHYRDYDFKVLDDLHYEKTYNPRPEPDPCPIEIEN